MDAIARLNYRHDAIAEWLVANPDRTLGDCARDMGYTQAWLSRIVNSDMFQAYYHELCAERKQIAVHSIGAKMTAAASLALDQMMTRLAVAPSDRFVLDSATTMLDRLGYTGGKGKEETRHLHLHLTPDDINEARESAKVINAKRG